MGQLAACRRLLATWLLAALVLALPAWGRTVLELDAARQPVPLADWGDAWIDATGEASVHYVATDGAIAWTPTAQGSIYPLTTGQALWVRFVIPPRPTPSAGTWRSPTLRSTA